MIPNYLSAMWAAAAPALGNHLWQSTLFAIVAGLLTLILRKNQARTRYWLWLAASVKFLIPFSLLVGVGSHLAWSHSAAPEKAGAYFAMEEVSQPFTQQTVPAISREIPSTAFHSLIHVIPVIFAAAWLCGFLAIVSIWCMRWRRISAATREAAPLREGREVEALAGSKVPAECEMGSRYWFRALRWSRGFSASSGLSCCGRKEFRRGLTTRSSTPFSPTNSGTCVGATIWPQRCTWWLRRSFGFTHWSGGWARG
jgi:hypothetical protein